MVRSRRINDPLVAPESSARVPTIWIVLGIVVFVCLGALLVAPQSRYVSGVEIATWGLALTLIPLGVFVVVSRRYRRVLVASRQYPGVFAVVARGAVGSKGLPDRAMTSAGWFLTTPSALEVWEGTPEPRLWLRVSRERIVDVYRAQFLSPLITSPFLRIELSDGSRIDAVLVHGGVGDIFGYRSSSYEAVVTAIRQNE